MRMTEKNKAGYCLSRNAIILGKGAIQIKEEITDKLGQLEDIEEELGIDLITLVKALKQETLFIKTDFDVRETIKNGEGWGMKHFEFEDGEFVIFAQILYPNDITHKEWLTPLRLKLSDYGKTWALDKNDLTSEEIYGKI